MPNVVLLIEDEPQHAAWLRACVALAGRLGPVRHADSLETAQQLLDTWKAAPPRLVLLDLRLHGHSSLPLLDALLQRWPKLDVLVVSAMADETHCLHAIRAGARGFVVKDGDDATLVRAIEAVRQGLFLLSPAVARHMLAAAGITPTRSTQTKARGGARMAARAPKALQAAAPQAKQAKRATQAAQTTAEPVLEPEDANTANAAPAEGQPEPPPKPVTLSARERAVLDGLSLGLSYDEVATVMRVSHSTVQTHVRNLYRKLKVRSKVNALLRARLLGLFSGH